MLTVEQFDHGTLIRFWPICGRYGGGGGLARILRLNGLIRHSDSQGPLGLPTSGSLAFLFPRINSQPKPASIDQNLFSQGFVRFTCSILPLLG